MPSLIPPHLHPLVVHFPIVLIPLAAALATFAAWKRPAWATNVLLILVALCAVSAFVADQLGDADLQAARGTITPDARALAHTHEQLAQITVIASGALFALGFLLRKRLFWTRWSWAYAAALWGLFALVTLTAWYGGALVYEQGVNTP